MCKTGALPTELYARKEALNVRVFRIYGKSYFSLFEKKCIFSVFSCEIVTALLNYTSIRTRSKEPLSMRRSICYCEPSLALAGEINTWKFIYTTATTLPKGTILRFDLISDGRDIDWELPSTNLKDAENVIYAKIEGGKAIEGEEIEIPDSYTPLYEFTLPTQLKSGESLTIYMGSPKLTEKLSEKNGTQAQTYSQRRRPFLLYIDPKGKKQFEDPEMFYMDIRGNVLDHIKVVAPSFVSRNKRFDVTVRFEDEFGNLTSNAPEDTLIELSYEHLRENLKWKLFVPETGFITLPNLYFNEQGFYTIQLLNMETKEVFRSAPIRCSSEETHFAHWGLLHGESERVDSSENIENCLRHFRDERALTFFASSNFDHDEETPNDLWKLITQNISEFDEADRFSTFLGSQWVGKPKEEGVRQFVYNKDNKALIRQKDAKFNTLKKVYKSHTPKELLSIPCFTMGNGNSFDFENFDPEFERVVEIYNSWGCSERTEKEGNTTPIKGPARKGVKEAPEGALIEALKSNCRFGFVAGGLDDRGCYASFFENEQEQYFPGLTAIVSEEHTRQALWEALYNRSCYATTGARMITGISIAGTRMGGEVSTEEKPGLHINRHIAGYVAGTTELQKVELIRNGEVLTTFEPEGYHYEYAYDDMVPLSDVVLKPKDGSPSFAFYYVRTTQEDGHISWSSPIWIDCLTEEKLIKKEKKISRKK